MQALPTRPRPMWRSIGDGPSEDLLFHRILASPAPEAYFRDWARALRAATDTTVILVGGLRTTSTMRDVLISGDADFLAMARPLIREPDIVRQIESGREGWFAAPHATCA